HDEYAPSVREAIVKALSDVTRFRVITETSTSTNWQVTMLVNEEDIYNLPDYKNKNMTQDKTVNHACFYKEYTYLSIWSYGEPLHSRNDNTCRNHLYEASL
ncbi:hypothetical protein PZH42_29425, partial [Bacteroides cellulosilyticus]